jgi:hypothetical protein
MGQLAQAEGDVLGEDPAPGEGKTARNRAGMLDLPLGLTHSKATFREKAFTTSQAERAGNRSGVGTERKSAVRFLGRVRKDLCALFGVAVHRWGGFDLWFRRPAQNLYVVGSLST